MDRNQLLNDQETAIRYALDGRQAQMWTALPAIVTAVDLVKMTVECQPAIQGVQTFPDGSTQDVNLPLLVDCPICFPSAGGFILTLPIAVGDEVLVVIASRCIDAWWQQGGVQPAMEVRMHDLSDGFVIPGPRSQPNVVGSISSVNAELRNDAGTVKLSITPAGAINMTAPAGVKITGNLNVTGEITGKSDTTPIPLTTHRHTGVTTGGGTSGGPTP